MSRFVAIDTGGTNIKFALMDENAAIFDQGEIPTPRDTLDNYLDALEGIYKKYADAGEEIEAVVMSAPGRIDAQRGYFYTGGALGYMHNVDLAAALKDIIPVPFCAENDAKAAALAELWKGSMKDVDHGVVITLGTGIGGAVIINGQLYRGKTHAAGEFSGCATNWNSRTDGNAENWAGLNSVNTLMRRYANRKNVDPETMNGRIFFENLNNGDEDAQIELDWYCDTLATAIYTLQSILDVEKYAFGGGISRQPKLIASLQRAVDDVFNRLPDCIPAAKPEIVACDFSSDANLLGALYHYLNEFQK